MGCGFIGRETPDSHTAAYQDCERTTLAATCDNILGMWTEAPYHYISYINMVKIENLDIVSVCTPVETHCKIVCDIAPYVKAIYCEKPMALTMKECDYMIGACDAEDTILQINHQRRFVKPLFRFSRDLIDTGTHVFDFIEDKLWGEVDVEYIDTQEHIFELVITRERMILAGVNHLVECLDRGDDSISSGDEARVALRLALEFKENYERNKRDTTERSSIRLPSESFLPSWWEICP